MLADDDVAGLDISMENPARVGILDRIADVHEAPQQLAQFE
jgi:hypothetical protein